MNQAERCHQFAGCTNLFVDAFKAFKKKTTDASAVFVLTHYHGDHYAGLPKDGSYAGPARIHCTPVTGALLRSVHGVPERFIVEHPYGKTWVHRGAETAKGDDAAKYSSRGNESSESLAEVTFYDANHCPGAAIVFVRLPDGNCHLHTGDMRYHEKMRRYPLLKAAAAERRIDLLYLDTTYSHPKHDFVPQDRAVESIGSQVKELFARAQNAVTSTLVLLSCYSIGKEKVLWECAERTGKKVYVNERKHKMLECIRGHRGVDRSSSIVERCTENPEEADIHVIPMGLAGEIWPYFRPNYNECAKYSEKLERKYGRVVAFVPTGWANASNWNKKNAMSHRRVDLDKIQGREGSKRTHRQIDVEVRLISYSEHSAFSELCSFVEFLKPRKVIPTVYSGERDYDAIERRFKDLIDSKRAKEMFLSSMKSGAGAKAPMSSAKRGNTATTKTCKSDAHMGDDELSEVIVLDGACKPIDATKSRGRQQENDTLGTLVSMGFESQTCKSALEKSKGDVGDALELLLTSKETLSAGVVPPESILSKSVPASRKKKASPSITQFFNPQKKQCF